MKMPAKILFWGLLPLLVGCGLFSQIDEVEQDRRKVYQKSQPLPDLEVPPDLTVLSSPEELALPGERAGTGSAGTAEVAGAPAASPGGVAEPSSADTVAAGDETPPAPEPSPVLENRTAPESEPASPAGEATAAPGAAQTPVASREEPGSTAFPQEPPLPPRRPESSEQAAPVSQIPSLDGTILAGQIIRLRAEPEVFWPRLRSFWQQRGRLLELDDMEIGVMETTWAEFSAQGGMMRNRFRILSEQGTEPGQHLLVLSSDNQRYLEIGEDGDWLSQERDLKIELEVAKALYAFLQDLGAEITPGKPVADTGTEQLRIIQSGERQEYLLIPNQFPQGWQRIGNAIRNSGMQIEREEQEKGLYQVLYQPNEGDQNPSNRGLFPRLFSLFSDDAEEGAGKSLRYQIRLVGVGDKTEVVVLDEEGLWNRDEYTRQILALLQSRY